MVAQITMRGCKGTGPSQVVAVTGSMWLLQSLYGCYGSRFCSFFVAKIALRGSNGTGPSRGSYGIYMAVTESLRLLLV